MDEPKSASFLGYWEVILKASREGYELVVWLIVVGIGLITGFADYSGLAIPWLDEGHSKIVERIVEALVTIFFVSRALLWMPYHVHRRNSREHVRKLADLHEGQKREMKRHDDEISALKDEQARMSKRHSAELAAFEERLRPKLKLACGIGVADSVTERTRSGKVVMAPSGALVVNGSHIVRYYRMEVSADSVGAIKGCRAQLQSIEKDGRRRWGGDEALLTFAPGEAPDTISKTIQSKGTAHLDVLFISDDNEVTPATQTRHWRFGSTQALFAEPGEYFLKVLISAEGMTSMIAVLRFNWTGNRETSGLTLDRIE